MAIIHLGAFFDASEGKGLTFIPTFPWLECLLVLGVFFLFYPLPHHRHLSSFARPPPTPLSSCVIFWLTPHTPWLDDVIYEQPLRLSKVKWLPYFEFSVILLWLAQEQLISSWGVVEEYSMGSRSGQKISKVVKFYFGHASAISS